MAGGRRKRANITGADKGKSPAERQVGKSALGRGREQSGPSVVSVPNLPPSFYVLRDNPPKKMPVDYSPAQLTSLCELLVGGLSMMHAKRLLGIGSPFNRWRKACPKYIDGLIGIAESLFVADRLSTIRAASNKSWQAAAWMLERRFPTQFALAGRGKGKESGPINIVIMSSIPRPYEVLRRRGLKRSEPGRPPGEAGEVVVITGEASVDTLSLPAGEDDDEQVGDN